MSGTPYIYQGEEIGTIVLVTDINQADDIETRRMYAERMKMALPRRN